jgi:hypothetical protein
MQNLKEAIITLLNGSAPYVWSREEMARSLGCANDGLFDGCLRELVRDGRLRKKETA